MKFYILIFCSFVLTSCNLSAKNESTTLLPCYYKWKIPKATKFKVNNKNLYYMLVGNDHTDLKIFISDSDLSRKGIISSDIKYFSKEETLTSCLKKNNFGYIQEIWSELFNGSQDKREIKILNGNELLISRPSINTFKTYTNKAEIKSLIYNNLGDTTITTIEWAYEKGRYVLNQLTTVTRDENLISE